MHLRSSARKSTGKGTGTSTVLTPAKSVFWPGKGRDWSVDTGIWHLWSWKRISGLIDGLWFDGYWLLKSNLPYTMKPLKKLDSSHSIAKDRVPTSNLHFFGLKHFSLMACTYITRENFLSLIFSASIVRWWAVYHMAGSCSNLEMGVTNDVHRLFVSTVLYFNSVEFGYLT